MKIPTLLAALLFFVPVATSASAKERLILETYPADPPWREVTNVSQGDQFLRELIPDGQRIETYRDILTAQSFPGARNTGPSAYLQGIFKGVSRACTGVRVNGPKAGEENGFPVAYAQVYCGRQKGKDFGVNMFFKVIQGQDALYVVQREFRVPPSTAGGIQTFSKDQVAEMVALMNAQSVANTFLVEAVYLCSDTSTDPKCSAAAGH